MNRKTLYATEDQLARLAASSPAAAKELADTIELRTLPPGGDEDAWYLVADSAAALRSAFTPMIEHVEKMKEDLFQWRLDWEKMTARAFPAIRVDFSSFPYAGPLPRACSICGREFGTLYGRRMHRRDVHGVRR